MTDRLSVKVADVRAEARDVMLVELRAAGQGALPAFEPGAHIEVALPNGLTRHYSLCNDWRERDRYVIGVGRSPDSRGGSAFIHQALRRGATLNVSAPRNNFPLDPDASGYLFIAGGIGITPIMAMVRWCVAMERSWQLVYASRSRQNAAFYGDLRVHEPEHVQFHFDDEAGGVLDVAASLRDFRQGTDAQIYCCGPQPLMTAVGEATASRSAKVHFEYFTAPSKDEAVAGRDTGGFQVRLDNSGETFEVPPGRSILEVLEENGYELPFSCREGLCGTCRTAVVCGEIDHRDYVLSDEEHASGKIMMICVSRARSPSLTLDL